MCLGCCRPGFKAQKVLPAPVLKIIVLPVIICNTLDFFEDYFTGEKKFLTLTAPLLHFICIWAYMCVVSRIKLNEVA